MTVTDTPVSRETDYGRVDEHSSATRAAGDARHTYNRVPDYPVPGADPVYGSWTGGRITVSSSSSDSTAMPDVAPATSPAAAIDGDPATAWVSSALQTAVGQWLQVNFDHPVTNAAITLTPSATAVGAQVRRILIETATGSTTLRFDEAGKPLTAALPYGETPWVRVTATGTDDGSGGVQFGITDLSITQYDAAGFAQPVDLRHTVRVPGPPTGAPVAAWDLGSELLGRPGCAPASDTVRCAASKALVPEEPANFSRTLTVPAPVSVTPMVWVRPRQGPKLADLIAEPNTTRAQGDSDTLDVLGSAYAATDGDPSTAWTAPQRMVQHKTPPTLTITLPRPTLVTGLRLAASRSALPAHPTMVAVNLGDGPQVQQVRPTDSVLSLRPRTTDTITLSLLDWQDVIDRNALGFDQLKPPGLAEVAVLGADGNPIAPADAARNRAREIVVDCAHGPVIAVAGRFVHTSIRTTAGALLDGAPVAALACDRAPIALPAGQQEFLISPGAQFVVDGAALVAVVSLIAGVLAFGLHPLVTLSGTTMGVQQALALIGLAYLLVVAGAVCSLSIAFFISTLTDSSLTAATIAIAVFTVLTILNAFSVFDFMKPYTYSTYRLAFLNLFRFPIYWPPIRQALVNYGVTTALLLLAAWAVFSRKDILT